MHPIEHLRFVARATGADAGLLVQEAAQALAVFDRDPAALVTACRRLLTRQPGVGPLWWMASRLVTAGDARDAARSVVDDLADDRTARELSHALPGGATVAIAGWPDLAVAALRRRGDVSVVVVDVEGQGHGAVRSLERVDVEAEAVDAARLAGVVEGADVVLVEAGAVGSAGALTDIGSLSLAAVARATGTPVWLVAGMGRALPDVVWNELVDRVVDPDALPWTADHEVVGLGLVDRVVGWSGPVDPDGVGTLLAGAGVVPSAPELLVPLR